MFPRTSARAEAWSAPRCAQDGNEAHFFRSAQVARVGSLGGELQFEGLVAVVVGGGWRWVVAVVINFNCEKELCD